MAGVYPLRPDLEFAEAGFDVSGEPGVVLHDPPRHRFFHLSAKAWRQLAGEDVSASAEEKEELHGFLQKQRLLQPRPGSAKGLHEEFQHKPGNMASRMFNHGTAFRLHLWRPETFLDFALPFVTPLVGRHVACLLALMTMCGIYFSWRQWDQFSQAMLSSFSVGGAAMYATTLFVLKVLHELGHALVARAFGCRVPSIGVSFMVLVPMLYTDTTDAWRLASRRQRFMIAAAGVLVELALAASALMLWAFLPDGPLRQVCFFVAVSAWMMSVMVNLSPFMRFDGYHMLADGLGMHSLGSRSFAMARWKLVEVLFKPNLAPPEFLPRNMTRFLVGFALGTWVYRLFLFAGIAWLIYASLPKVVGAPMAAMALFQYIAVPVSKELKAWFSEARSLFGTGRGKVTLLIGLVLGILAFMPLDRHVHVPAVLLPGVEARVYAPEAAQILTVEVVAGARVEAGQILARLHVPEIGLRQRMAQQQRDIAADRLQRIAADATDRSQSLVLLADQRRAEAELAGLQERGLRLVLRSPLSGRLTADAALPMAGAWTGPQDVLFHVIGDGPATGMALVLEREAGRISAQAPLRFVGDEGTGQTAAGVAVALGLPGGEGQALAYLGSRFGGRVEVVAAGAGAGQKGSHRHLPLRFQVDNTHVNAATPGIAVIEAEPMSLAQTLLSRAVSLFVRESSF